MNRIAELRRERGLTQIQLSKALGISQSSLSGYENGKFEPDQEMLLSMAKYFDVSVDYLLCRTSQKKSRLQSEPTLSADQQELLELTKKLDRDKLEVVKTVARSLQPKSSQNQ